VDQPSVFLDGLRLSAGNENYKTPPPSELTAQLLGCFDDQIRVLGRRGQ
jgi:hypothetical protein